MRMDEQAKRALTIQERKQQLDEMRKLRQIDTRRTNTLDTRMTIAGDGRNYHQNGTLSSSSSARNMDALLGPLGLARPSMPPPSGPLQRNGSNLQISNGSLNNIGVSDASSESNFASRLRPTQLEVVTTKPISIAPKNDNRYTKWTQTFDAETHMDGFSTGSRDDFEFDEMSFGEKAGNYEDAFDDTSPSHAIARILGKSLNEPQQSEEEKVPVRPPKPPELSQEQREKIVSSESFQRFLSNSTRWIERAIALEKDKDIFADYANDRKDNTRSDALLTSSGRFNTGQYLPEQTGRAVDFSDAHPELVAVAINGKSNSDGPEGVINVWNTNFSTASPECVFHSNSQLKSMCFAKFHPKLVIGGCASGQLCIWDLRSNKRNPVNKSSISARSHTQAIMQIQLVGTQHTHDLATISLDGVVCWWSLDNLHTPIEKVTLSYGPTKNIPLTSISFDPNDASKFVCSAENGALYLGDRSEVSEERKVYQEIAGAHQGAISKVDVHRTTGPVDFSRYCLTSSMDFTCKLWNLADYSKPVFSFENKHGSYVTDISWSPVHPAAFVSSSLTGTLNLWNLNTDSEDPLAVQRTGKGIYRSVWSHNGRQIATLDETGVVQLYDVHESLYNVKPSEWEKLSSVCREAMLTGGNSSN